MAETLAQDLRPRPPLRLWPGVAAVTLLWLVRFGMPRVFPDMIPFAIGGGMACGLAVIVWWLFFSRAAWVERIGAILLIAGASLAMPRVLHESIATGMRGIMFFIYSVPVICLALVLWAVATRGLPDPVRRATMVATILLACGGWALLRTQGVTGGFNSHLTWRWTPSPEEKLLARGVDEPPAAPVTPASLPVPSPAVAASAPVPVPAKEVLPKAMDWPGFRGLHRDGVVRDVRIDTDWAASPPVEMWRRPVGPGWSSFAVEGDRVYTQEQRGESEVVSCYDLKTGKPVWAHRDATRFWESNGGAGPRGTPTLANGRVYTVGATGIVNSLKESDGSAVWSRNLVSDTDTQVPGWGFASSPLVVGDVVVVAAAGRLLGYDSATGSPRWTGPKGGGGYSSPHLITVAGIPQVLLISGGKTVSVNPVDGALLWEHDWESGTAIVQPAVASTNEVLISASDSSGAGGMATRRLAIVRGDQGWKVEERWTSRGLKPYYNDMVIHRGHAFGFDGSILSCIDLQDGKRKWKGGRYGFGQMILLAEQGLLLVLSEEGDLALVGAGTEEFKELGRFHVLEGKTWNHPVLVGDTLLVRNSEEMAAYQLATKAR